MPIARAHRLPSSAPDDVQAIEAAVRRGDLDPSRIVAVLGKTEGNGCVNDFTRGFASQAIKQALASWTGRSAATVGRDTAIVLSGGTEGGLSPHWLLFEVLDDSSDGAAADPGGLAVGVESTREFAPEEIGRMPQIIATAEAVTEAMRRAGIAAPDDVHYVQVKCPLLTKQRVAEANARGHGVVTEDTYGSMGHSRGASALGVALALGEVPPADVADEAVCQNFDLYSTRASTSAGVELMENQVVVLGNSPAWRSGLVIGHGVMRDAIDVDAVATALRSVGIRPELGLAGTEPGRVAAVFAKAEPSRSGLIRGRRHIMLDDSDIQASRHARALVGGVLAGVFGDTQLFVSGGAEHQGPDGGGPIAVIARRSANRSPTGGSAARRR